MDASYICVWLGVTALYHAQGLPLKCPVCRFSADVSSCLNNLQFCNKGMCRLTTSDRRFHSSECVSPSNCTATSVHILQGVQSESIECCTDIQCFQKSFGLPIGPLPTQAEDGTTYVPLCQDDPTFPCAMGACQYYDIRSNMCPSTCGFCGSHPTVTTPSLTTSDTETRKPPTQDTATPTIAASTPEVTGISTTLAPSSTDQQTKTVTDTRVSTGTTDKLPSPGVFTPVTVLAQNSTGIITQTTQTRETPSTLHTTVTAIQHTTDSSTAKFTSLTTDPSTSTTSAHTMKSTHRTTISTTTSTTTTKSKTTTDSKVTQTPTTTTSTTTSEATTTTSTRKMATNTTSATTTATTVAAATLAPVVRKCLQCGDIDSGTHCTAFELFRPTSVTCPQDRPFCMTDIIQNIRGEAKFYRRCVSLHTCETQWYAGTSDISLCTHSDPTAVMADITCSYCCTEDNCNKNIIPLRSTLYTPRH